MKQDAGTTASAATLARASIPVRRSALASRSARCAMRANTTWVARHDPVAALGVALGAQALGSAGDTITAAAVLEAACAR